MPSLTEWKVPPAVQPRPDDYSYDLERALSAVVGLHSIIPPDAFTADTLGVERAGNGVLIDKGLILTIGYLMTEAETVWLHLGDGRVGRGPRAGFDQETGFGLVQALGLIDLLALALGSSRAAELGERGGRRGRWAHRFASRLSPPNRNSPAIGNTSSTRRSSPIRRIPRLGRHRVDIVKGELIGIGSLQLERAREGRNEHLNMTVPIDLFKPILDDFGEIRLGR